MAGAGVVAGAWAGAGAEETSQWALAASGLFSRSLLNSSSNPERIKSSIVITKQKVQMVFLTYHTFYNLSRVIKKHNLTFRLMF